MYSFSKLSTIEECKYQAYLNYVEKRKSRKQNVWAILGSKLHDKLEQITNGEATTNELPPLIKEELNIVDTLGIKFPKDFKGGDSIRNNWVANMTHFCENFIPLEGKFSTEELVILKLDDDHYIQGYIDLVKHNEDGSVSIMDWKTSALYKGDALEHAAHQLVIYGMAKEAEGETVKDLSWVFMKYAEIKYKGYKTKRSKEKSLISKVVERRNIVKELTSQIQQDMLDKGYDDLTIDIYIEDALKKNGLEALPSNIRELYNVSQYILTIPYTEEAKEKTMKYVWDMVNEYEKRSNKSNEWEHKQFTKINSKGNEVEDTFYCNCLCSFGDNCEHIKIYNELATMKDDGFADLFG